MSQQPRLSLAHDRGRSEDERAVGFFVCEVALMVAELAQRYSASVIEFDEHIRHTDTIYP